LSSAIANKPQHVSIRPHEYTLGRTKAFASARPTSRIQVHLAGFAAEHILTRRRSRQLEQEVRFALVARLDERLRDAFTGSEDRDGDRAVEEIHRMIASATDDEVQREIDRFYEIVRESLLVVWPKVASVAKALLKHEELDAVGIDAALGDHEIYAPIFAIQRKHGLLPD
jgi:ATP-dependent Zn protease